MGPLPFRYLRWRRVLAFVAVLTLSLALSSITALSLTSFYSGMSSYAGGGKDVVVLYDAKSRTPFTGLVPALLADRVAAVSGVLACSPEVLAPCIVKGEAVFLRGVLLGDFLKVSDVSVIDGEAFGAGDVNSVIIGRRASERIGAGVGDEILVIGVLSPACFTLRVKGIFRSDGPLEDEIIAPLHVGQWLRGSGYGYVTIIRAKVCGANVLEAILGSIAEGGANSGRAEGQGSPGGGPSGHAAPQWANVRFRAEDVGIRGAEEFVKDYMERYGVTRESILVLSVATIVFSGATILLATETLISQHGGEIEVLRSLGASRKLLRRDVALKLLPAFLLATALGLGIAVALLSLALEGGLLQVLFHSARLQVDASALTLTALAALAVVIVSAWRCVK
ncbi:MAG: FtsX-like permease family protein [Candidatus Nezhaarchaeales archaeon]